MRQPFDQSLVTSAKRMTFPRSNRGLESNSCYATNCRKLIGAGLKSKNRVKNEFFTRLKLDAPRRFALRLAGDHDRGEAMNRQAVIQHAEQRREEIVNLQLP